MASRLNYDCIRNILEFLECKNDQDALFRCLLVNRLWCEIAVPYLWKDPFSIVHRKGAANSKKLLKTIILMFPFDKTTEDKLNSCRHFKFTYLNYEKSVYNYLSFLRIFKSTEFHGFIDKCTRVKPWKYKPQKKYYDQSTGVCKPIYDEGPISSILSRYIYEIIFKTCTEVRQISLITIPYEIQIQTFDILSNLYDLQVGDTRYLKKITQVCEKIKEIKIIVSVFRKSNSRDLINFFKVQQGLKVAHFFSRARLFEIPKEILIHMCSIEELIIKNFTFSQIDTSLSKLRHLEITLTNHSSDTFSFQNLSCPLLEVLKFHNELPSSKVLAEFIEKTEGHLQHFYLRPSFKSSDYVQNLNTQLLLGSIAKSCPKIKSLDIIIDRMNTSEDLSLLKHLLLSCNELNNLTLTSMNHISQSLLQVHVGMIDENWNVKHERRRICKRIFGQTEWFNEILIEKA